MARSRSPIDEKLFSERERAPCIQTRPTASDILPASIGFQAGHIDALSRTSHGCAAAASCTLHRLRFTLPRSKRSRTEPNVALYGAACRCSQGVALFLSFSPRTDRPLVSGKHRYGRRDRYAREKERTFNSPPSPLTIRSLRLLQGAIVTTRSPARTFSKDGPRTLLGFSPFTIDDNVEPPYPYVMVVLLSGIRVRWALEHTLAGY